MPIYEYQCLDCCSRFEIKRSFNENSSVLCPKCQGETRRIFSPVPIFYKGTGFYTTDNPGGGGYRSETKSTETEEKVEE